MTDAICAASESYSVIYLALIEDYLLLFDFLLALFTNCNLPRRCEGTQRGLSLLESPSIERVSAGLGFMTKSLRLQYLLAWPKPCLLVTCKSG